MVRRICGGRNREACHTRGGRICEGRGATQAGATWGKDFLLSSHVLPEFE